MTAVILLDLLVVVSSGVFLFLAAFVYVEASYSWDTFSLLLFMDSNSTGYAHLWDRGRDLVSLS
jgi:hypothetical protein